MQTLLKQSTEYKQYILPYMQWMPFQIQGLQTNKSVNKILWIKTAFQTKWILTRLKIALQKGTEEPQSKPPQLSLEVSQANLVEKVILKMGWANAQ